MDELQPIFDLAYFYLKFRLRSKREMRDYLYEKSKTRYFSRDLVDKVIGQLEERGLINDKNFTEAFIHARSKNRPKSEYVLRRELNQFGIGKEIIDTYFDNNDFDEEKLAAEALLKKINRFNQLKDPVQIRKATAFLSRRGFSYDTIKKTLAKFTAEE